MDRYHVTLFIHILALIVATSASAVVELAIVRRDRARTLGEVLDWHNVLMSTARVFPICLATFVITGSYMLSITKVHVMSTGFVVAGLVGAGLLLVSGVFLGTKGKALKQILDEMAKQGADQPAPKLVSPPLVAALPVINTGIALTVAFDMVTKPASIPVALGVLAIGIVLSVAASMRHSQGPRPNTAPAAE
jgi:hypothetical protein